MIFLSEIARDGFGLIGDTDADLDGRTPDGASIFGLGGVTALAVGLWVKHPSASGGAGSAIKIDALKDVAYQEGPYQTYVLTALPAEFNPVAHGARTTARWIKDSVFPGREAPPYAYGYVSAGVRYDPATDTGYICDFLLSNLDPDGPEFTGPLYIESITLWEVIGGVYTILQYIELPAFTGTVLEDVDYPFQLDIDADDVLRIYVNGALVVESTGGGNSEAGGTFDLHSSSAYDTDAVRPSIIASGLPAMSAFTDGTYPLEEHYVEITEFCALNVTACEGPPENPYPEHPPPPIAPLSAVISKVDPATGRWVGAAVPQLDAATRALVYTKRGRVAQIKGYWAVDVRSGRWVLGSGYDGETLPEPDTPVPPYTDPCHQVVPIDPGPIDPLTGRYFGMSNMPVGALGPLYTLTQRALFGGTEAELDTVLAAGGIMVTAQGGYKQYMPSGSFVRDTMLARLIAKIDPLYAMLAAHAAHFGFSWSDDFTGHSLWPPTGISQADFTYITVALRTEFPGIRIGSRARPDQFGSDPGLQFYSAQSPKLVNAAAAFAFGAEMYAIAAARSAFLFLDLNYLHGGNGSSGVRYFDGTIKGQGPNNFMCSSAEVYTDLTEMWAGAASVDPTLEWLAGSKGYQWLPAYVNGTTDPPSLTTPVPGVLAAQVSARNVLATYPTP